MSMEILATIIVLATAVGAYLVLRRRQPDTGDEEAKREREDLDTVAAWPPEVTRVLGGGERAAHDVLIKALPECVIFAQVPLARFIRVPRRHSYGDWLTRVGHLCVEFLICDRASLVIGAVTLQAAQESVRAAQRRARMVRVLKAAGIKVFVWREQTIPTPQVARDQIVQRTGTLEPTPDPAKPATTSAGHPVDTGSGKLAAPEVDTPTIDGERRLDPPPSTWLDDLNSGSAPLDPPRKRPGP